MSKAFRCQLRAEAKKDEAELLIYDEIGASWFGEGVTAKQVVKDLAAVTAKKIRVRINSAGGEVFEGLAIYNALRTHTSKIVVEIDGIAASIASIIALAGDEVKIADNAFYMIHNPHGIAFGNAADMREMAELLDKVGGSLAAIYVEHTGMDMDEIQALMDAETWFTAEEAKAAGFVTAITKGKQIAARADLSAFSNAPLALRAAADLFASGDAIEPALVPPTEEVTPEPTAAGGAAPDSTITPAQPAPKAQGEPMSQVDTAAQAAGAEAEKIRAKQIRALGKEHKIEQGMVDGWLDADLSVQAVKDAILEQIRAQAETAPKINARVGAPRAENDPRFGFDSPREFLLAVMKNKGTTPDGVREERLRPLLVTDEGDDSVEGGGVAFMVPRAFSPKSIRAAVGSDEQGNYSDTYGGFLKPVQVQPGLLSTSFEGDPTAGLTTMVPMSAPVVKFNARTDKNHSTSVSGGLTFSRTAETAPAGTSRMAIEQITLEAQMLVGAAYATEQVLMDSPISFAALLAAGFQDQRAAHMLNEKIRGLGGSEYLGVLNSPAKVEIAKETSQAADTILYDNVLKMRARTWGYGGAVWLANHDCLPELAKMSLAVGTGGAPVFMPGQFGQSPDTLLGRPLIFSEYMNTVGDAGDIACVNWSQYLEGIYQPMRSDESIHVRFLNLERAFRFYERNAGAPWWRSALTPAKGSNTLSPIVTLAVRS